MKQNPKLQTIQENMAPGAYTAHGFLGDDTRNLLDILKQDQFDINKLGTTHEEVARRMRYFTEIGITSPDVPIVVDDIYEVTVDDHRGYIPCPFADNVKEIKRNTKLTNLTLGKTIYWSDLTIHMIEKHGFYEGKGSFFRNDPDTLYMLLGL
ncbi:MAG: hypothetical protein JXQ23_04770 [Clostridia bacterium]|nr:hypothetical protein [Clostridia bacterium]